MSDNVFDEALEDFDNELEDFDDDVGVPASSAPAFKAVEEAAPEVKPQEKYNMPVKKETSGESVFAPIDDKELDKKIMERNKVWREATLSGENDNGVECALAHGLPDWDLMPPEMLVRRRSVK